MKDGYGSKAEGGCGYLRGMGMGFKAGDGYGCLSRGRMYGVHVCMPELAIDTMALVSET